MKSFVFVGVLWLALGYVRPSSQTMTDYILYNTQAESCPDEKSTYGATCLQLYSQVIYQCPYGFYYNNSTCRLGKVFPGKMILGIPYNESMQDTKSENYEKLYVNLKTFFEQTFPDLQDFQSINILSVKLSRGISQRVNKAGDKNETTVTLITAFGEKTNMTIQKLEVAINNSNFLNNFNNVSFTRISGCEIFICDSNTTDCKDVVGSIPTCECKPGMAKINLEDKACRVCDQKCSAENNKLCLMKTNIPECQCLPNFEKKDEECKVCSIGFSGEGCQDSYMAIIIGISTLCGVLLVALIGVTICVLRKQKPKTEERQMVSNQYSTLGNPYGVPPATNLAESGRMFPRIRATNGAPSSKATAENPNNFYREGAANRGYVPEHDYSNDNWLEIPSRY